MRTRSPRATVTGNQCQKCAQTLRYQNNGRCVACTKQHESKRNAKPERKQAARKRQLKTRYGLNESDYNRLLVVQSTTCAICDRTLPTTLITGKRGVAVDHDHTTGKVRGLLCSSCNNMLGHAKDNINTLLNAVTYLQAARL